MIPFLLQIQLWYVRFCNYISTVPYICPFQIPICIIFNCCVILICASSLQPFLLDILKFRNFSLSAIKRWTFLFINLFTCLIISKWLSNFISRTFYLTQMLFRKLIHSFIHSTQWFTTLATPLGEKNRALSGLISVDSRCWNAGYSPVLFVLFKRLPGDFSHAARVRATGRPEQALWHAQGTCCV